LAGVFVPSNVLQAQRTASAMPADVPTEGRPCKSCRAVTPTLTRDESEHWRRRGPGWPRSALAVVKRCLPSGAGAPLHAAGHTCAGSCPAAHRRAPAAACKRFGRSPASAPSRPMSFRAVVRCHPGCHGLCLTALRYTLFATRPCARAFLALPPCLLLAGPIGVGLCKGSLLVASLNCHKLEGTFGNLSREGLLVCSTSPVYA